MAFEKIGLDAVFRDAGFNAGVAAYQKGISAATIATGKGAAAMSAIGRGMSTALVTGIGAATVAFGALAAAAKIGIDSALQRGEELDKLGDMFGMNARQADIWATAMSHFKIPIEEGAQQLNFFTRGLAETVKIGADGKRTLTPFGEALDKLGVKAFGVGGKLKTFDQIMPEIMDRFAKLPAGVNKSNLAMELFGARGGSKMLDFLSAGSKGLADATKRVDAFGGMTDEQRDALEDFGFALGDVQENLKKIWSQFGIAILPVLRRFVDFINNKVLPVIAKWVKDNMPALTKALGRFVDMVKKDVMPVVQRLVDAFQKGGLKGVFDQIATEIQNAMPVIIAKFDELKTRFWDWLTGTNGVIWQVGDKMKEVAQKIGDWIRNNKSLILGKFDELKTSFWNWLTGKGGALEQASVELGKLKTKIEDWIRDNAPAWGVLFETWKTNFWNWLTDPNSGVIAQIAESMGALTENVRKWSELPETQKQFQEIGQKVAQSIIDGMKGLFTQKDEGEDLLNVLARNLQNAYFALLDTFRNIGRNLAIGVIRGIVENFTSPERATEIAHAIFDVMEKAVNFAIEWGNIFTVMRRLATEMWNAFTAQFRNLASTFDFLSGKSITPTPVPAGGGSGGGGGSTGGDRHSGGPILQSGRYNLLAGGYVMPAHNLSNSRVNNFNFSHTWNSSVSTSTQQMTESMVRRVTQQEIREVMRKI